MGDTRRGPAGRNRRSSQRHRDSGVPRRPGAPSARKQSTTGGDGAPASARPAKPATSATPAPPTRSSVTGRIALLALVLVMLMVSYAYPLRSWYEQRAEHNELEREAELLEESVADLEGELRLWDDPAYVAAQARARLGYVMPGERGYIVVSPDEDDEGDDETAGIKSPADDTQADDQPTWYQRLWGSVEAADGPPTENDR